MTQRERTMTIALLVGIFVVAGGFIGYQFILSPLQTQNRLIATLTDEIDAKKQRIDEIETDLRTRYEPLRKLSLPADVDLARREYEMQLSGLLRRSDFQPSAVTITPRPADAKNAPVISGKKTAYTRLDFVVQVKGELSNLVDFLDHFYRQPLLHQIRTLSVVRPNRGGGDRNRSTELDITMTIEAIVLDNAEARATLAHVPSPITIVAGPAAGYRLGTLAVESGLGSPYDLSRGRMKPEDQPGRLAVPERLYTSIPAKNIFLGPPPPAPTDSAASDSEPREPDLAPFIRLTAISDADGYGRAHLFDFYNKYDYQIEQRPDGVVSVEGFYFILDRKKRLGKSRDLEVGDRENGNYARLRIVKVTDSDLFVQVPDADLEKRAHAAAPVVAGGVAALVIPGKMYKWHIGQLMKEMTPLSATEARRQVFGLLAAGRIESAPPGRRR